MEYMFWYAYEIKQNLCAWRLKDFPFNQCTGIFGGSGCQYKEKPVDTSSSFCEACSAPFEDNQELRAAVVACASPSNQGSTACQNFMSKYGWPMNSWEVGRITDMSDLFTPREIPRDFNEDISSWDVSSVTDMHGMFSGQYVFNKDISEWDVSRVTNMRGMFRSARKFNQVRRLIV